MSTHSRWVLLTSTALGLGLISCAEASDLPPSGQGATAASGGAGATGGAPPATGGFPMGTGGFPPGTGGTGAVPGTGGVPPATGGTTPGTGAVPSTGGVGGGGSGGSGGTPVIIDSGPTTNPGYTNLAPPLGAPLDPNGGTTLNPPAPTGWTYYEIEGAICRDGSPAGFFAHWGEGDGLLWYLEGGGACISPAFCNIFNPDNVNELISGDGQTALGSVGGVVAGRQQPGAFELGTVNGIFDLANPSNPFADWSMIYTPYCTGDVHFGTKPNGTVEGVAEPQQFVGYFNMQKFLGRIYPTFKDSVSRVILTGASAGSFGAALNYSMVQDTFDGIPVDVLMDSGIPFTDTYMYVCMQQYWRDTWGLDDALPPDCTQCFNQDGGGLLGLADFVMEKHPRTRLAAVSSQHDEIIRLFFGAGMNNCSAITTSDPVALFLTPTGGMPAADYAAALDEVRSIYTPTGRLASYLIGDPALVTFHQHIWRARFYQPAAGGVTIADFVQSFLDGNMQQVGP